MKPQEQPMELLIDTGMEEPLPLIAVTEEDDLESRWESWLDVMDR